MRRLATRRALAAALSLVVLAALGAGAYAQFGPSSSPPAPTSPGGGGVTMPDTTLGPLTPQLNPADTTPVSVTVDNAGTGSVYVGRITGAVETSGGCESAWFSVAAIPAPGNVSPGVHSYASSVILNDNDRDQSACTSQSQTIHWTSAGG